MREPSPRARAGRRPRVRGCRADPARPGDALAQARPARPRSRRSGSTPTGASTRPTSSGRCPIRRRRRERPSRRRSIAATIRCWRSLPTCMCGGCSASRFRAIARCPARFTRTGMQACMSTRPPSAWLVLLRRLPARRHDLRPRRTPLRLHGARRGLPQAARRAAPPLRTQGSRDDRRSRSRTTSSTSRSHGARLLRGDARCTRDPDSLTGATPTTKTTRRLPCLHAPSAVATLGVASMSASDTSPDRHRGSAL